jgi:hypothetical protein
MKNLIKVILTLLILIVTFIKVYVPLMSADENRTYKADNKSNFENLSIKENRK